MSYDSDENHFDISQVHLEKHKATFNSLMYKKGFNLLGTGSKATVFQAKDSGEVVKIFADDEYYIKYLHLVTDNKNNPTFPRIKSYAPFQGKFSGLHIVKMEKLQRAGDPYDYKEHWEWIEQLVTYYRLVAIDSKSDRRYNLQDDLGSLMKKYPDTNKACELIGRQIQTFPSGRCTLDIGYFNVMFRNKVPVIIDPYYTRDSR